MRPGAYECVRGAYGPASSISAARSAIGSTEGSCSNSSQLSSMSSIPYRCITSSLAPSGGPSLPAREPGNAPALIIICAFAKSRLLPFISILMLSSPPTLPADATLGKSTNGEPPPLGAPGANGEERQGKIDCSEASLAEDNVADWVGAWELRELTGSGLDQPISPPPLSVRVPDQKGGPSPLLLLLALLAPPCAGGCVRCAAAAQYAPPLAGAVVLMLVLISGSTPCDSAKQGRLREQLPPPPPPPRELSCAEASSASPLGAWLAAALLGRALALELGSRPLALCGCTADADADVEAHVEAEAAVEVAAKSADEEPIAR